MTAKEILLGVKELLRTEASWCQRTFARNAKGDKVEVTSEEASSWCLHGAVAKVVGGWADINEDWEGTQAVQILIKACNAKSVGEFNDCVEYADAMAALDRAIALAEAQEKIPSST